MDNTQRYYLSKLPTTWLITHQNLVDGVWISDTVAAEYYTWQEAIDSSYSPLAMDPQSNWPNELGGQS